MQILAVELEPTHYKTDLWNAVVQFGEAAVSVLYTERRNWSPDGGHDYQRFPADRYEAVVLEGKGWMGALRSSLKVLGMFRQVAPDLIYIAGYVHLPTVAAIVLAALLDKRFVVHADVFNTGRPVGRLSWLKWRIRETLRRLVFARAEAVFVCGRLGVQTAIAAGCPVQKVLDFPYCVSVDRIRQDQPDVMPEPCVQDLRGGKVVVFFSGRMIPRKGLATLLDAMATLRSNPDWVLWIEGAGPELQAYRDLATQHGLGERCRFLGFCQYDLHSWLTRSADIVAVPSFEDSWGIVVDEGLQLGKAVVSSDATGSGQDRIDHGKNGFMFPAGDIAGLSATIAALLNDRDLRIRVGQVAATSPRNISPKNNAITLMNLVGKTR